MKDPMQSKIHPKIPTIEGSNEIPYLLASSTMGFDWIMDPRLFLVERSSGIIDPTLGYTPMSPCVVRKGVNSTFTLWPPNRFGKIVRSGQDSCRTAFDGRLWLSDMRIDPKAGPMYAYYLMIHAKTFPEMYIRASYAAASRQSFLKGLSYLNIKVWIEMAKVGASHGNTSEYQSKHPQIPQSENIIIQSWQLSKK